MMPQATIILERTPEDIPLPLKQVPSKNLLVIYCRISLRLFSYLAHERLKREGLVKMRSKKAGR
jgi:hypothetical protein